MVNSLRNRFRCFLKAYVKHFLHNHNNAVSVFVSWCIIENCKSQGYECSMQYPAVYVAQLEFESSNIIIGSKKLWKSLEFSKIVIR